MAKKINLVIDQGATFTTSIDLLDSNGNLIIINGHTAASQMRRNYASSNSTSFNTLLSNGNITLTMNAITSSTLSAGRYVYDVELTDNTNNVTRIAEGIITVTPNVTR